MYALLLNATLSLGQAPAPTAPPPSATVVNTDDEPLPRFRGAGLMVGGAMFGVAWIGMKATVTANDLSTARAYDRDPSRPAVCIEFCYIGPLFHLTSLPLLAHSMALLGGGLHQYGLYAARRDALRGRTPRRDPRFHLGLGLGLLGVGTMGLIATQALAYGTGVRTELAQRAVVDVGWWMAGVAGMSGAALVGYGHGRLRGAARTHELSVAPLVTPTQVGIGLSGRF